MKKSIILFVCLTFFTCSLFSQIIKDNEECTLEISDFLVEPGTRYSFNLYITRNPMWDPTYPALGSIAGINSSVVFNIMPDAFINPILNVEDVCLVDVEYQINGPNNNFLTIDLISSGNPVPTTKSKLLSIILEVNIPNTTAGLSWKETATQILDNSGDLMTAFKTLELIGSDDSNLPIETEVQIASQNYIYFTPNPFGSISPHTSLSLVAPESGRIMLNVFNIKGQLVNILYNDVVQKNQDIQITWNGTDSGDNDLSSGIYLYQLLIENRLFETKKVVIIR